VKEKGWFYVVIYGFVVILASYIIYFAFLLTVYDNMLTVLIV